MGNHRFRLSDMIPNAWFYKLKDMGTKKSKAHTKKHSLPPITTTTTTTKAPPQPPKPYHQPRQSYHFPRDDSPPSPFKNKLAPIRIPDPPRKSAKKRRSTSKRTPKKSSPRLVTTSSVSVSADCSCSRASIESVFTKPDSTTEEYPNSTTSSDNESLFPEFGSDHGPLDNMLPSWSSPPSHTPCSCIKPRTNTAPAVNSYPKFKPVDLPQIKTNKTEPNRTKQTSTKGSMSVKVVKEDIVGISQKEQRMSPLRKNSANSPGMKLRTNSPRIGTRRVQVSHRKSLSSVPASRRTDSFAVIKASKDPQRDFKESMVEMIMENNIRTSKDLEELLACYLSLNSDEYHDLIIKVFKQIWFDTIDIRLNMHLGCGCSAAFDLKDEKMSPPMSGGTMADLNTTHTGRKDVYLVCGLQRCSNIFDAVVRFRNFGNVTRVLGDHQEMSLGVQYVLPNVHKLCP